jgi:hypothetical protein
MLASNSRAEVRRADEPDEWSSSGVGRLVGLG